MTKLFLKNERIFLNKNLKCEFFWLTKKWFVSVKWSKKQHSTVDAIFWLIFHNAKVKTSFYQFSFQTRLEWRGLWRKTEKTVDKLAWGRLKFVSAFFCHRKVMSRTNWRGKCSLILSFFLFFFWSKNSKEKWKFFNFNHFSALSFFVYVTKWQDVWKISRKRKGER